MYLPTDDRKAIVTAWTVDRVLSLGAGQAKDALAGRAFAIDMRFAILPFVSLQLEEAADAAEKAAKGRVFASALDHVARKGAEVGVDQERKGGDREPGPSADQLKDEQDEGAYGERCAKCVGAVSSHHKAVDPFAEGDFRLLLLLSHGEILLFSFSAFIIAENLN